MNAEEKRKTMLAQNWKCLGSKELESESERENTREREHKTERERNRRGDSTLCYSCQCRLESHGS